MAILPRVETFEIVASSQEQEEDAGWYYQLYAGKVVLGEPQGPFRSREEADNAAREDFII